MPRQPYSEAVKSDRRSGYIVSLQKGRGLERDVEFPLAKEKREDSKNYETSHITFTISYSNLLRSINAFWSKTL